MDSVTQFALGAAVGAAALGPRLGPRKAVLLGGILGTLPDLDTFVAAADPVAAFTGHRGPTHSLVIQALVTPLFAEPLVRLVGALKDHRIRTYLAVYSIFATHALIDAMTVYGTRLFWPLMEGPVGVGSIFIIDPLYTLPLLIPVIWGLFQGAWGAKFKKAVATGLAVSTAYMLATVPMQRVMHARAETILADTGVSAERLLAIPTPFNVLYWRAIAVDGGRYVNLDMPLFGGPSDAIAYVHPRRDSLEPCLSGNGAFKALAAFTKGFYALEQDGRRVIMSDLRMGLPPSYVFRFHIANLTSDGTRPVEPPTRENVERSVAGDIDWVLAGIAGNPMTRPAQADAEVALGDLTDTRMLANVGCQRMGGNAG